MFVFPNESIFGEAKVRISEQNYLFSNESIFGEAKVRISEQNYLFSNESIFGEAKGNKKTNTLIRFEGICFVLHASFCIFAACK